MNLNLLQLRYFYVTARERSFTRAAKKLRIAQPSLSKMIRQLEESLDRKLLVRSKKEIALTSHGAKALEYCRTIFECSEELVRALGDPELNPSTPVTVGTSDVLASHLLPPALKSAKRELRALYPVIHTSTSTDVCAGILSKRLDFGLLFYVPESAGKVSIKDIAPIRFHLVVAKRFRKNEETLQSFIGSREVDEEGAHRFPTLAEWRKTCPTARISCSSNCIQAHLQLVTLGLGISVLPAFLIKDKLQCGDLVDLMPKRRLMFPLKLVSRQDFSPDADQQKLIRAILETCKSLN